MEVEVARFGRLGVHKQATTADLGTELSRSRNHGPEHPGAETSARVVDRDTEAVSSATGWG